ncbi:pentapeptide repeat-containing protein [Okeania sp. SIO3I5]|uniref:pentapeptide repeat-containing protein n=1 Tax=Okeania sp. SIO3I5 TaxID=2607805 RepID=UPI0025CEA9B0|nr:pentapeptide repeat-containing protein [Okeania sp. SIO3I5]
MNRAELQNANLANANLEGAKLQLAYYDGATVWPDEFAYKRSGAVGPGADLSGAFLNTAYLRGVDLQGANLRGAYLSGTDLTGANLQGAALSGANMKGAFLIGANLRNARLNAVELDGADLRAADLTGASLDNIISIAGVDFSLVQGLSDDARAMLCGYPGKDLSTWNSFTRTNTESSLLSHLNG